jgi:hypothetical protein
MVILAAAWKDAKAAQDLTGNVEFPGRGHKGTTFVGVIHRISDCWWARTLNRGCVGQCGRTVNGNALLAIIQRATKWALPKKSDAASNHKM